MGAAIGVACAFGPPVFRAWMGAGRDEVRAMLVAALGCNLAWGLVDAVMYLVRTVTDRGRAITLIRSVRAAGDLLAALAIFLLVVVATFPVVLLFVMFADIGTAKTLSRAVALTMLFFGGLALGRYAGYGSWKVGLMMSGLGTALIAAVIALGG